MEHSLSFPNVVLLGILNNGTAIEWGVLGARGLNPSAINYKPHINSRIVQGGRPGTGARMGQGDN